MKDILLNYDYIESLSLNDSIVDYLAELLTAATQS